MRFPDQQISQVEHVAGVARVVEIGDHIARRGRRVAAVSQ